VLTVLTLGTAACGKSKKSSSSTGGTTTTAAAPAAQVTKGDKSSFYLAATDQMNDGKSVKVDEAVFTGSKGWVAIHSDAGGAPGPVIGVSKLLDAGTANDVVVTLDKPLTASAQVFPMLHLEDNNNTTYDFPNGDAPAKVGADVVVLPIKITVG
jgi:hypothetical protein